MQPTQEGRGQKRKKKLAEEIIVRAKTDTREEKRSNEGLSKKKEIWAGMLLATIPLFFHPRVLSCIFLLGTSSVYECHHIRTLLLCLIYRLEPQQICLQT